MKTKIFNDEKMNQSISGRKKTILFFLAIFVFAVCMPSVFAYTEQECTSRGGACSSESCGASANTIGICTGAGNRTNCCGSASMAQQLNPTINPSGNLSSGFRNPIGANSIEAVLGNIMSYLRGIAGAIAVIFIIIGGIMYMLSGGSKEMSERAKKTLIYAIAGLAIVLAAPLFYTEIKAVLSGSNPGSALQQVLMNILRLLLSIVGFLAIISMIVGAIWMLTAAGEEERYELGKKTATYSILGLVIAVSALIIANQVMNLIR